MHQNHNPIHNWASQTFLWFPHIASYSQIQPIVSTSSPVYHIISVWPIPTHPLSSLHFYLRPTPQILRSLTWILLSDTPICALKDSDLFPYLVHLGPLPYPSPTQWLAPTPMVPFFAESSHRYPKHSTSSKFTPFTFHRTSIFFLFFSSVIKPCFYSHLIMTFSNHTNSNTIFCRFSLFSAS